MTRATVQRFGAARFVSGRVFSPHECFFANGPRRQASSVGDRSGAGAHRLEKLLSSYESPRKPQVLRPARSRAGTCCGAYRTPHRTQRFL